LLGSFRHVVQIYIITRISTVIRGVHPISSRIFCAFKRIALLVNKELLEGISVDLGILVKP
jgi:hypothetical protein